MEDILEMPELYEQIVELMQITRFESNELAHKGTKLARLYHKYIAD